MPYCEKCGNKLSNGDTFCSACGNKVSNNQNVSTQRQHYVQQNNNSYSYRQEVPYSNQQTVNYQYQVMPGNSPLDKLRKKLQIDMIIWIVVASIQAVLALCFFIAGMTLYSFSFGDTKRNCFINGIVLAIVSILNFVSSYKTCTMRTRIATIPTGIVGEYESLGPYVINLVYNAILGGLIGIVGSIYSLVIRSYVMSHKAYFIHIENSYRKNPHEPCWRCTNCGRINPPFEEICMCGFKKLNQNTNKAM